MDSDQESRIFFIFCLTWIVSTGVVSSRLYLRPWNWILSLAMLHWGGLFYWIGLDWNLLEEGHSLCVMLEHCEHGFQQASLDGEQLQHLVQEDIYDF